MLFIEAFLCSRMKPTLYCVLVVYADIVKTMMSCVGVLFLSQSLSDIFIIGSPHLASPLFPLPVFHSKSLIAIQWSQLGTSPVPHADRERWTDTENNLRGQHGVKRRTSSLAGRTVRGNNVTFMASLKLAFSLQPFSNSLIYLREAVQQIEELLQSHLNSR